MKIKFIKDTGIYKEGEIKEASEKDAKEIIAEGYATELDFIDEKHEEQKIVKEKYNNQVNFEKAGKVYGRKGQAELFLEMQPVFYDRNKLWWVWNKSSCCWEMSDEVDILNAIESSVGANIINSTERIEIINSLKQSGRKKVPKPVKQSWLQFKNKIFDIETGEEFEATSDYFVTNPIPYELHKDKFVETPTMDKIFEEWVGKDNVQTLYEIIAYCCLPSYPIHRLFCLVGAGLNGKSCFLRLLKKFIGEENCCATELDLLLSSRFEVGRLYKKLVCIMGETNFNEISQTSIIKKLTGQDLIGFEHKGKNPFEANNYAKILIATNNLPATTDKTIGFYRRWLIIDFPNQFSEENDILTSIPEEEYQSLAIKCSMILHDLIKTRKFTNEGDIENKIKRYEERSNPFDKFWDEYVDETNPDTNISKTKFAEKLNNWCKENKFRTLSDKTIANHMKDKGINTYQLQMEWVETSYGKQKPRYWAWGGIKWKE